jgi:hypothetical protein
MCSKQVNSIGNVSNITLIPKYRLLCNDTIKYSTLTLQGVIVLLVYEEFSDCWLGMPN